MAVLTERAMFYHIPKCGGTWVRQAMENAGIACKTAPITWRHPFGPMIHRTHAAPGNVRDDARGGRFAFTFVRHPVEWYRSYWTSIQGVRPRGNWWLDRLPRDDLNEWALALIAQYPGFVTDLYRQYAPVEFVGKRERLPDDLVEALTQAGETFDEDALRATPRVNVGATVGVDTFEPGVLDAIREAERDGIRRWYV